jgi:predicted ribosome quality control (RQC) complex YloA/Tae2 family protein
VNLSHLTLRRVTHDLEGIKGARIQDATLLQPNALLLDISRTAGGRTTRILISGSRSQGRICVTETPYPAKPDRPPWVDRYLLKAVVRNITLQPDDRIITLDLDKQDRVGSRYPSRLIVEMMGRDSNAILVDPADKIQGLLRPHASEHRKLHPGGVFTPAKPQDRRLPSQIDPDEFARSAAESEDPLDPLLTLVTGMNRHLARELLLRAEQNQTDLLAATRAFYENPPFDESAGCLINPVGNRSTVLPFKPQHLDDTQFEATTTISEAIERVYQESLKVQEERGQKKDLLKTLARATKTAIKKRDRIAGDLDEAKNADLLEQKGSLILAQAQQIESGAVTAELENLFDENHPTIKIELNPNQSAAENGQAFLKKAAKARKSEPVLERRLGQTEATISDLEALSAQLEKIQDENEVDDFRMKLETKGLIRPKRVKPKQGKSDPSGLHPRKYRTSDGWEVWVGRNDSENDRITKTAPRNAIWMHAHGCPGSHVVLRPRDQRDPSPEALHDAASLAAYWSKARGSKTVPVNYTEARYVQKPKGAPPGLVTIRNEKTLFVNPREIEKWEGAE